MYVETLDYRSHYLSAEQINSKMAGVYKHMGLAVFISMLVSYSVSLVPVLMAFFFTGWMQYVTIFLPLIAVIVMTIALRADPPKELAQLMLVGFAAIMGLSFASIFAVYELGSVFTSFMGAAVLFGTMSFYGYFTKRSLDSFGKFLFIGLIAIIIAVS